MDPQTTARQFHEDGFVVVRQLLSTDEVAEAETHIAALMTNHANLFGDKDIFFEDVPGVDRADRPIKSMFRLEQRDDYFESLRHDARFLNLLAAIWPQAQAQGEPGCGFVSVFAKSARTGSSAPPHQDNGFQNWDPPEALLMTIAIDASTPENGALTINRGSHRCGLLPHRPSGVMGFSQTLVDPLDEAQYPPRQLCLQPGDVAFHHINAVHHSQPNTSDRSRRQLVISYHSCLARRNVAAYDRYQAELEALHASRRPS